VKYQQQELSIKNVFVHRKSVDKYCHKKTIQKAVRERAYFSQNLCEDLMSRPTISRQFTDSFSFLHHCIFCGKHNRSQASRKMSSLI